MEDTSAQISELEQRIKALEQQASGADAYGTTNNFFVTENAEKEVETKVIEALEALLGPIFEVMFASPPTVATGEHPTGVVVSPDNNNVYVCNESGSVEAFKRNAGTGALTHIQTVATGGTPERIGISEDGTIVCVSRRTGSSLLIFERGETGELTSVGEKALEAGCEFLHVSKDGNTAYTGNESLRSVDITNPKEPVAVENIALGGKIRGFTESDDEKFLYVTFQAAGLKVYERREGGVLHLVQTLVTPFEHPWAVILSPDQAHAYVAAIPSTVGAHAGYAQYRRAANGELTAMTPATVFSATTTPNSGWAVIRPDGRALYQTGAATGLLALPISRPSGAVQNAYEEKLGLESKPLGDLAISPDGLNLYIPLYEAKELQVLATI